MANPNTLKTMAPETAARIRTYVNGNPYLRNIIKMLPHAAPVGMGYQQFVKPDDEKPVPAGRTFGRLYEVGRWDRRQNADGSDIASFRYAGR